LERNLEAERKTIAERGALQRKALDEQYLHVFGPPLAQPRQSPLTGHKTVTANADSFAMD
jgi:hypothetical protein